MSDYIHLFETQAAHDAVYNGSQYTEPWVGLVTANDNVSYNKPPINYTEVPLTFVITGDGNVVWKAGSGWGKTIEYKKNNGEWTQITSTRNGVTINVTSGDTIQFRGDNSGYGGWDDDYGSNTGSNFNGTTATFKVQGNIMSLINSTEFSSMNTLGSTAIDIFALLFTNCTTLTDASNLILPATTLQNRCYFRMFYGCTNLTKAPILPAETLAKRCYTQMFYDCSNLNYIECLATNISAENCVSYWVSGVSATGTFTKAASMTSWPSGISGIPSGWTVQDAS